MKQAKKAGAKIVKQSQDILVRLRRMLPRIRQTSMGNCLESANNSFRLAGVTNFHEMLKKLLFDNYLRSFFASYSVKAKSG